LPGDFVKKLLESGIEIAILDIDGTVSDTDIIEFYAFMKKNTFKTIIAYYLWAIRIIISIPYYFILDTIDRELFQRAFLGKFNSFSWLEMNQLSEKYFKERVLKKLKPETINLIEELRNSNIRIEILSFSISPLIEQYAKYFGVEYSSLKVNNSNGQVEVDYSEINEFKLNTIKKFNPQKLVVIADSKTDLPIFNYAAFSIVVSNGKSRKWMKALKNAYII